MIEEDPAHLRAHSYVAYSPCQTIFVNGAPESIEGNVEAGEARVECCRLEEKEPALHPLDEVVAHHRVVLVELEAELFLLFFAVELTVELLLVPEVPTILRR